MATLCPHRPMHRVGRTGPADRSFRGALGGSARRSQPAHALFNCSWFVPGWAPSFLVLYFLYRFAWVGLRFIGHFVDLGLLLVVVQRPFRQFGRIWQIGERAGAAQEEAGGDDDDNAAQPPPRGACGGVVGPLPCCCRRHPSLRAPSWRSKLETMQ